MGKLSSYMEWRISAHRTTALDICFSRKFDTLYAPKIVGAIYKKYGNGVEDGR